MSDVERHQARVAEIERLMLAEPETIPVLRTQREAALAAVREAEALEDAEHAQKVHEAAWAAIASLRGDVPSDWFAKHRRWMSRSTKARLVSMLGRRGYEAFPWMVAVVVSVIQ